MLNQLVLKSTLSSIFASISGNSVQKVANFKIKTPFYAPVPPSPKDMGRMCKISDPK